jgi:dTDP-4-dehydrorhamnose 3,5-epimerase-like enzyme
MHQNDPMLGIIWPLDITEVSERDKKHAFINANFKGI